MAYTGNRALLPTDFGFPKEDKKEEEEVKETTKEVKRKKPKEVVTKPKKSVAKPTVTTKRLAKEAKARKLPWKV